LQQEVQPACMAACCISSGCGRHWQQNCGLAANSTSSDTQGFTSMQDSCSHCVYARAQNVAVAWFEGEGCCFAMPDSDGAAGAGNTAACLQLLLLRSAASHADQQQRCEPSQVVETSNALHTCRFFRVERLVQGCFEAFAITSGKREECRSEQPHCRLNLSKGSKMTHDETVCSLAANARLYAGITDHYAPLLTLRKLRPTGYAAMVRPSSKISSKQGLKAH
jgi:hypothetical protein